MTTETLSTRSRGRAHTLADVSEILKISKRRLIREIRAGRLKAVQFGPHMVRIFDADLDAFIAQSEGVES
jgi:excisionase family DNA binding protein